MGFSSRAGLGERWVGRKQGGFSQGVCRLCGEARFPVAALLMSCPHGRTRAVCTEGRGWAGGVLAGAPACLSAVSSHHCGTVLRPL